MTDKMIKRKHYLLFIAGGLSAILFFLLFNKTVHYTSSNEFCNSCHVHPHAEATWRLSPHHNTSSGVSVNCVDCHLPDETNTMHFLTRKAYHGFHDLYAYVTMNPEEIDWEAKRSTEAAQHFVYEDGCLKCHTNMFPATLSAKGSEQHIKYIRDPESSTCIQCHHGVGHYRGETTGFAEVEDSTDPKEIFTELTPVSSFKSFNEKLPGTAVSFNMIAIPGGEFKMGSPADEANRRSDEGPVREVVVDSFWMAEIEVSWDEYLAFFTATSSQGRKEAVEEEETDAVSGATPPWGAPDQGWGKGSRPAITMSHLAAETYCRWLTQVTGRTYRLPTEAEWEYAARGGTETPFFFEGSPKDYDIDGFFKKLFGTNTEEIDKYVIWQGNSPDKTQEPAKVEANPFGLKNMLGNVAEFCSDFYDPTVYGKYPSGEINNPRGPRSGNEHVVRGGSFMSSAKDVRAARRDYTRTTDWLVTDPQIPKSIWWYSDVKSVGFRVVCEYNPEDLANGNNKTNNNE